MLRAIVVMVALSLTVACTPTYNQANLHPNSQSLDSSKGVLIAIPRDGWYGNQRYQNSGTMTANAVKSAFSRYALTVNTIDQCADASCLASIDTDKYGYFVQPVILHWEDRATEWSGRRDHIDIQLIIYDTKTGEAIVNGSYQGASQWATLGGDHPQDLLPEPTNGFVAQLYQ